MIKYYKLNQYDVLSILSEHFSKELNIKTPETKSTLLGVCSDEFRAIIAISDADMNDIDLEYIDKTTPFNGDYSRVKWRSSEEMINILDSIIERGDF